MRSPACSRQENIKFPPHIHGAWGPPFRPSMYSRASTLIRYLTILPHKTSILSPCSLLGLNKQALQKNGRRLDRSSFVFCLSEPLARSFFRSRRTPPSLAAAVAKRKEGTRVKNELKLMDPQGERARAARKHDVLLRFSPIRPQLTSLKNSEMVGGV